MNPKSLVLVSDSLCLLAKYHKISPGRSLQWPGDGPKDWDSWPNLEEQCFRRNVGHKSLERTLEAPENRGAKWKLKFKEHSTYLMPGTRHSNAIRPGGDRSARTCRTRPENRAELTIYALSVRYLWSEQFWGDLVQAASFGAMSGALAHKKWHKLAIK